MSASSAYLQMIDITREFPGVVANKHVNFSVRRGEVHALVGENGAGKSTLMNILYGLYQPNSGQILLNGNPVIIPNPQAAIALGIGMVHQHFQLVPSLTVAENVALGYEPRNGVFVDRAAMIDKVRQLSQSYGLQVDPLARVADLSVGVQQRVEILKLLYRDARLLIMDEPSAVLTPQEVNDLFEVLRRLVAADYTVIFITHKLHEVMEICQRATILRRGEVIDVLDIAKTTAMDISQKMVGRNIETTRRAGKQAFGAEQLTLQNIEARNDRGLSALRGINLDIRAGEIVGIAGVEGNGQSELVEIIVGLRKPTRGQIIFAGADMTDKDNRYRREHGLAVIPEDRNLQGLSKTLTVRENVVSTRYYQDGMSRYGFILIDSMRQLARHLMQQFDIRAANSEIAVGTLSGGNAQKVVVARELARRPRVLIGAHPTRGLDIGAAQFVHQELFQLRADGIGILLISADLDELMLLSDRIIVMFEGQFVGEVKGSEATSERLGLMMTGRAETTEVKP
jgi:general nucleoside transport system ATP-binding protein